VFLLNNFFPTMTKLLVFQAIGELFSRTLVLPIPGPVIGMVFLLICLMLKGGEVEKMAPAAAQLLGYLPLFFVPAAVGILVHLHRVASEWLPIVAALIASTVAAIIVSAAVMRWLQK
jgi:holin-like protein